jgi:TP901 family phage tail tape measure protein
MADAMKVFGVSADVAANTMSSAADASSTSIEEMTMAFSQSAAVAALANQSMGDLSAALAVLANNGVKGSDAGTSVKTMLMRLMAPADDAAVALQQVGLSVMSFRNADGSMKPLVEIIGTLNGALAGMDQAAKDDIFRRIFGQDAIRAAAILTATGVDGFNAMTDAMGNALPVSEKYKTLSAGLAGAMASVAAAMQRAAIAISDAVGPALMEIAGPIKGAIDGFTRFTAANKELVAGFAKASVVVAGVGVSLVGVGLAVGGVSSAIGAILAPLGFVITSVTAMAAAFLGSVFSIASAIVSVTAYGVARVAAATASGAAWAIANIPLLLLVGAAGGLVVTMLQAYDAVGMVQSAVGSLPGVVGSATKVFADLGQIGRDAFGGIADALADGDIEGAIKIMMAGAKAAFYRGSEAIMSVIDGLMAGLDAAINDVMGRWEDYTTVFGRIGAFFGNQADIEAINAIDQGIVAYGSKGRLNSQLDSEAARSSAADGRRAATIAAQNELQDTIAGVRAPQMRPKAGGGSMASGPLDIAAFDSKQAEEFIKQAANAATLEALSQLTYDFNQLAESGNISTQQIARFQGASDAAMAKIDPTMAAGGAGIAAIDASQSRAEVAGTFSSTNLGGMGFGSSLAERQLQTLQKIEQNTANMEPAAVAE